MNTDYEAFLLSKRRDGFANGQEISETKLPSLLFPFQRALVRWALRKGRAALWADTGLGKTFMQLAWAQQIPGRVLVLAPLCVGQQTVEQGRKLGLIVGLHVNSGEQIEVTNYERLHQVQPANYQGIVLDESSILKAFDGKTRSKLIGMFRETPYRLCCTATPAPNDIAELANHCEFLGIMTRMEMLATFFVHDDTGWRLKRPGAAAFYEWLALWGMFLHHPSDLGFSDDGFHLPPLDIVEHVVETGPVGGALFPEMALEGIHGRHAIRRATHDARAALTAELVNADAQAWIVWCGLNVEQTRVTALLTRSHVSIFGTETEQAKVGKLLEFLQGRVDVLVTKPKIAGFGLNLQRCARMAFLGLGDSYETYYQAIRRCWRFGQARPVTAHIVISSAERVVVNNVRAKEVRHREMSRGLLDAVRRAEREELMPTMRERREVPDRVERGRRWTMHLGDCVEVLGRLPEHSVDLSVYSPPFIALYTYTASDRDFGNCSGLKEFLAHFAFFARSLLRVTKPGRVTCCHVAQVATTQQTHGVIGLADLRGAVIQTFVEAGWIYHGDICIDKNPQAQAIRTHSKALLFKQLRKDASWLRPGLADFIEVFRAAGENAAPILPDISNEEWIQWARPVWYGIRESDTLNAAEGRGKDDERHIVPLQLGVIERCVRLWSNPNELVLSPFAGIGSEGHEAVRLGRRFVGVELKQEYWATAIKNLRRAEALAASLFDGPTSGG